MTAFSHPSASGQHTAWFTAPFQSFLLRGLATAGRIESMSEPYGCEGEILLASSHLGCVWLCHAKELGLLGKKESYSESKLFISIFERTTQLSFLIDCVNGVY